MWLGRSRPLPSPASIAGRSTQCIARLRRDSRRAQGGRGVLHAERRQCRARDLAGRCHEATAPLSGPGSTARTPRGRLPLARPGARLSAVNRCASPRAPTRATRSPCTPWWLTPRTNARAPFYEHFGFIVLPDSTTASLLADVHAGQPLRALSRGHPQATRHRPVALHWRGCASDRRNMFGLTRLLSNPGAPYR